jgi:hypothetical protein
MRGLRGVARQVLAAVLALAATATSAHRPSDAFLDIDLRGERALGRWEIALRDLDTAFALDADGNGALTWGELRGAEARLNEALTQRLHLSADGQACPLRFTDLLIHDRSDGPYAWFALEADCARTPTRLRVEYDFLFALDPSHRGLLTLRAGPHTHGALFSPDQNAADIDLRTGSPWRTFSDYLREGVHHIWIGVDHILFLLVLLLPCVLLRVDGQWRAAERLRPALWEVFAVVTAFTAAHSVTLSLAALNLVRLPAALVESIIALSVLLSALNNLYPVVTQRRWVLAFGFGLLHGFGFASVLGELGLPDALRALALIAFNLGVELGQLAIVMVTVPLAFVLRNRAIYRYWLLQGGSALIALVALVWCMQRSGLLATGT